jgi:multisubunit Na+/H+ antiporter MnhG subunit
MSPIDAICLTVMLLGGVFALAAGLGIALGGNAVKRMSQASAADSSGLAWVLVLFLGFLEEFPKTSGFMRRLFLSGLVSAALAALVWLILS